MSSAVIPRPDKLIARFAAVLCFALVAALILMMEGRSTLEVLSLHVPMTLSALAGSSALIYETELA